MEQMSDLAECDLGLTKGQLTPRQLIDVTAQHFSRQIDAAQAARKAQIAALEAEVERREEMVWLAQVARTSTSPDERVGAEARLMRLRGD